MNEGDVKPTSETTRLRALLSSAARAIESRPGDYLVVGIGGGSCSGKSTVATALIEHLEEGAVLLMDDYYRSRALSAERFDFNFDEPGALDLDLLCSHLEAIRGGGTVRKPTYDFKTHRRKEFEMFQPSRVTILEGLFALHENVCEHLDFGIFVDCSDGERLRRRIVRDSRERGRSRASIVHQYDMTVRPMHELHVEVSRTRAHLIVLNEHARD